MVKGELSNLKSRRFEEADFKAPGVSVLVVDDIEINLLIAQAMFEEYEMNVTLAGSGREAIELARKNEFDIVFMDHMMPEIDGIETTLELRKLGKYWEKAPIIALTANVTLKAQEMFYKNSLNDFIAKPVDAELLRACLHKWLPKDKIAEKGSNENTG
jgi:CheY-like chemotaxis protein